MVFFTEEHLRIDSCETDGLNVLYLSIEKTFMYRNGEITHVKINQNAREKGDLLVDFETKDNTFQIHLPVKIAEAIAFVSDDEKALRRANIGLPLAWTTGAIANDGTMMMPEEYFILMLQKVEEEKQNNEK